MPALRVWWRTPGLKLGLLAMACLALATLALLQSIATGFSAGWAGADYAAEADIETPVERADRHAQAALVATQARWEERAAYALALFAVLSALGAAWQTRARVRDWHWLAFLGLGGVFQALVLLVLADKNHRLIWLVFPLLVLFGVVLPALDLRRNRPGPGRVLAFLTVALTLALAYSLRAPLLGPRQ